MSASIIESKFQVLDRATKLLAAARHRGSKVSSQQLRDLVERERRRNTTSGGKISTSSDTQRAATRPLSHKKESRSARETTTSHIDSYPKASVAPESVAEYGGDPKDVGERTADIVGTAARRTHELRCRTWNVSVHSVWCRIDRRVRRESDGEHDIVTGDRSGRDGDQAGRDTRAWTSR
jgi:hypothetical protein